MADQRLMERICATAPGAPANGRPGRRCLGHRPPLPAVPRPPVPLPTVPGPTAPPPANDPRAPCDTTSTWLSSGAAPAGGTLVQALAPTGARILLVERGGFVPREAENWDPAAVWKDLRYRTSERWIDGAGRPFLPYTHYCVGGNTKFWGSVLYRLRTEDFGEVEHADGVLAGVAARLRHAGPLLRAGRTAVPRCMARRASIRGGRLAGPTRTRRSRTRRRSQGSSTGCARWGSIRHRCRWG